MNKSGFTLIEVLITLFILAIVLAIGVPSFKSIMRNSEMLANSGDVVTALNYARVEAVKRGTSVQLSPQDESDWNNGLVVWVDNDANNSWDSDEELRLWDKFSNTSSVVSDNTLTRFVFNASGEVSNADVLTLCDDRSGEAGRSISILISGAIFTEDVICE